MGDAPPSYENAFHYPTLPPQNSQSHPPAANSTRVAGSIQRTGPITRPKMGEVKLYQDASERRRHEELCDLYAIIKVTESLEAAYSRDAITSLEYAEACTRLIAQFKSTESALITGGMITGADVFMREFNVDCPRAFDRLIRSGVPATVLQMTHDDRADSVIVAETVQV
jgi:ESCRT-I complex subunit VPS28